METISRSLLTFIFNSLWQVPLVTLVAAAICRVMRRSPAAHRHAVWTAALAAAVLLPLASMRSAPPSERVQYSLTFQQGAGAESAVPAARHAAQSVQPGRGLRDISLARTTAAVLATLYLLFLLYRTGRFVAACRRTSRLCFDARLRGIPPALEHVWKRCCEAFGVQGVELRSSAHIASPVTAGARHRTIVLPERLLAETSEEVLTTAIGHEMAHIARHDFALNLLYEALYVPIAFQPAAWFIRRRIEQTREMACDELVTRRLMDPRSYAQSIIHIAASMMAVERPGFTLGVFDGDILQERIRRLLHAPAVNLKRARLTLAAGMGALAICGVLASGIALTARAQSGSQGEVKAGADAYNAGDWAAAINHFRAAVAMDRSSIRPKLFLATALVRAGQGGEATFGEARQQLMDVLAIDPRHKNAFQGLMVLDINLKRFDDARQWALKLIEVDPRDASAYYSLGFIDWAVSYPDYARTRAAAGMRPEDPGIIPDAGMRQALRTRIGAQVEDGFRVLQIALQLDPQYFDAMAYINLLYRIKSAIVDSTAESADMVAQADAWVGKALAAKKASGQMKIAAAPQARLDADGAPPSITRGMAMVAAPPPPPPPPPPPNMQDLAVSSEPIPAQGRAEGAYWQVAGRPGMNAGAMFQLLRNSGFRPVEVVNGGDMTPRMVVGPYQDEQALNEAKAALETAGFQVLRQWGTLRR